MAEFDPDDDLIDPFADPTDDELAALIDPLADPHEDVRFNLDVRLLRHLAGMAPLPPLRRCDYCTDLFVLTRTDRRFCSHACRQARWTLRHADR